MKTYLLLITLVLSSSLNAQCWQSISTGSVHSMAISSNGTLWSWGYNFYGQLGIGSNNDTNQPFQVGTGNDWDYIATGNYSSFGIKTNGTLWSWGYNGSGQLGDGTTTNRNLPVQVTSGVMNNWDYVVSGTNHSLAIKTDGTLWAWGDNNYGQVGNGTASNLQLLPIQIGFDTNWAGVSAGGTSSYAIKNNGTLWSWGHNNYGQLGDGTLINKNIPTQIGSASTWSSVIGGLAHTIALKTNGSIWTWGLNLYGQLGDSSTVDKSTPIQIGNSTNWVLIDAGLYNSVAKKNDGSLWGWGSNNYGQIGDGTNTQRILPVQIGNQTTWQSSDVGGHTLALKTDGSIHSCGSNYSGQLGNATNSNTNSLVPINCPVLLIPEFSSSIISFYPNPAINILNIINPAHEIIKKVKIINLLGENIMEHTVDTQQIEIDQLTAGVYILQIQYEFKIYNLKFIKM